MYDETEIDSYLGVVSGIISEADYIFCPESPPPVDWPEKLCNKLIQASLLLVVVFMCLPEQAITHSSKMNILPKMFRGVQSSRVN